MKITIGNIVTLIWLAFYLIIASIDLTIISNTINVDSDLIVEMASDIGSYTHQGSYYYTAMFFSWIPEFLTQPLIIVLGITTLLLFMKNLNHIYSLGIAAYLSLPCIISFLVRPQKETIVILITLLTLVTFSSKIATWKKLLIFVALYGVYAYFIRQYYFIIIALFFALSFFKYMNTTLKVVSILLFVSFIALVPDSIFMQLQGTRDVSNALRQGGIGVEGSGARTAFFNPFIPDDALSFFGNYIYAFIKLNFPIFFEIGVKELWLFSVVCIYAFFIFCGIRSKDKITRMCTILLLAHIFTLIIFEPDLGSYLRHFTSAFLYLIPSMILIDKKLMGIDKAEHELNDDTDRGKETPLPDMRKSNQLPMQ